MSPKRQAAIRSADAGDTDAVVALWTEAYFTEGEGGRGAPYSRSDFDQTAAAAAHLIVAEIDSDVVGVVALLAPSEPTRAVANDDEAELARLVVSATTRRQGIGRALADRCTVLARDEGWQAIALWSRPYQRAGHRLYESLGYRRDPDRDSTDETGFERLVYRLALTRREHAACQNGTVESGSLILRYADAVAELDAVETLWNALQAHHTAISPDLGEATPSREPGDAWQIRRGKYERWLQNPDTFLVLAEIDDKPVGYAFVTVGPGYASWQTGQRLAELETLSVLPEHRGDGVGSALLDEVWSRLAELCVEDMAITTTTTNVDSHRFYEREGFRQRFAVYHGKAPR